MSKTTIPAGGITDSAVTTAKINADAVTAAKIADDAISEEHLDATAITGHTALAESPADTDEFLISDGGVLKRLDASYIGGGTHVQTGSSFFTSSAGSSVSVTNCFSSTYDFYTIHFYFHFANNAAALRFRIVDSGGERQESQYQYASRNFESNGSPGSGSGESATYIELANSISQGYDDGGVHGILHVHLNNGHGTTSHSNTFSMAGFYKTSPDQGANRVRAYYHASNYIDTIANHTATGFNFFASSGNLEFGNVKVYGLSGSSS